MTSSPSKFRGSPHPGSAKDQQPQKLANCSRTMLKLSPLLTLGFSAPALSSVVSHAGAPFVALAGKAAGGERNALNASTCDPGIARRSPRPPSMAGPLCERTPWVSANWKVLAANLIQYTCGKQPLLLVGTDRTWSHRLKSCKVGRSRGARAIMWRNNNASRTLLNWPAQHTSADKGCPFTVAKMVNTAMPVPRPRSTTGAPRNTSGTPPPAPSASFSASQPPAFVAMASSRSSRRAGSASPPPGADRTTSRSEPSVSMPQAKLPTGST
mmetsp:Transcript_86880/g.250667  ORF Transcript_86880/g.250667 Transcript_86880/m.250667 type:complete len:269 (-) Transcript_86880:62-868(-)